MAGYEKLGVAEILDRADGYDHPLPSALDSFELPVQLFGVELAHGRFDLVPISGETNYVEVVDEKRFQGRPRVQAERLDLARSKAETKQGVAPGPDRQPFPEVVDLPLRPGQSRLQQQWHGNQSGGGGDRRTDS